MAKVNKCPHCKSKTGFRLTVELRGYQYEDITFSGKLITIDRQGTDDIDNQVECLDCGKSISINRVRLPY